MVYAHASKNEVNVENGKRHFSGYLIGVIVFMSLGTSAYGFSNAIIATTFAQPSFLLQMGLNDAPNAAGLIGSVTGLYYAGGVAGSICHGWATPRHGPKASVAIGCVFLIVSSAVLTGAVNIAMFIVFRFFNGWGAFQLLCTVPMWITEVSPPSHRGTLGDITAFMIAFGYTSASLVGLGFYFASGKQQWRGPTGLMMALPLILLSGLYWMPESPRYLISKDRSEEALRILQRLHTGGSSTDDNFAEIEHYQIRKQIEFDREHKLSYWTIFTEKRYRKRVGITIGLPWCLMGSGVLVINNYGALIYTQLGYGPVEVLGFLTGWVGLCMVAAMIGATFVDKVSRTHLIAAGFFLCMGCLIVEAALQAEFLGTNNKDALSAAVAMTFVFVLFYVICVDGPLYFYIGEIWPSHLRAQGFAIAISSLCISNMTWLLAAPTAFDTIGWKYYLFFIAMCLVGGIATLIWFPNTLHKPLEEIAAMFGDDQDVVVRQIELQNGIFGKEFEKQPENGIEVEDVHSFKV